jgi:hypothetical protein
MGYYDLRGSDYADLHLGRVMMLAYIHDKRLTKGSEDQDIRRVARPGS